MTLPHGFCADAPHAIPLHILTATAFPAWRDSQPEAIKAWLTATQFKGSAGSVQSWSDAQGQLAGAVVCIQDPHDPYAYAHAVNTLPEATWKLAQPCDEAAHDALQLGWGLAHYRFSRYKARTPKACWLAGDFSEEVFALLAACIRVRDLVNTPTEHMGPDTLETIAGDIAQANGGTLNSICGDALLEQNYPAIHAVGRASHRAPRLLELTWGDAAHPHLVLCGKGVCFDTGGLNMKASAGMRNMKKDMGGAAHALALAELIMVRKLPLRLTVLIAAVENAVSPNAFRPGEVIATRKGVSIEIDNTDAEGRLVLCDALTRACELQPSLILDFATLTGAARIALGPDLPALFSNDDQLANAWLNAGTHTRDPLWRMPLWRPYLRYLTSNIADLANASNSSMAGSVTAALYLERFIDDGIRWAHLDVYAWNDSDRPGRPTGGEAMGLRAAYAMLKTLW
jgi:leucyl aminopeptidase